MEIDFLNGESYFRFFKEISSIPRGSGNTEKIQKYLIKFAEQRNLDYACDEIGNVVIYKDKSADSKSNDPVILQGHMDMVTVKTKDSDKDLENEGFEVITVAPDESGHITPEAMAAAAPAMLPVPTVAASAVHTAWNGVIAPSEASFLRKMRPMVVLMA